MGRKPHILILMTDQQRADCLSCAGHPQIRTPHLDRIAGEGVRFTQAITVSPVCMPARASFINSLYPHNHGMWQNRGCLQPHGPTLFHHLREAGYRTAHIGKAHYYRHGGGHMADREEYMHGLGLEDVHETTGPMATRKVQSYMTDCWAEGGWHEVFKEDYADRLRRRGDNPFFVRASPLPVDLYPDSYVGRKAVEYIQEYDDGRPMCLFVGFPSPHDPWDAPGEYATMYDREKTPEPIPWPAQGRSLPPHIRDMEDFQPMNGSTLENIRGIRTNYYGKISLVDHWIGRILDALDEKGLLDNTLIVFWSDHGEMLGDHRRLWKSTFHESSMRVPLILRWPDHFEKGVSSDALVEIIDVYPTLMEVLDLGKVQRCLGESLLPLLIDPRASFRDLQLSEIAHAGERRLCIRTQGHKYAVRENGDGYMMYDLGQDPHEQNNIIGQHDGLEQQLRERLLRRLVATQCSM